MDPNSKQMIAGLKLGYDSLVAVIGEENAVELKEILDEMTEIAENNDYAGFIDKAGEAELFDRYNNKMDELSAKVEELKKKEGVKESCAGVQELETMRKQYTAMLEHARANPESIEYKTALENLLAVMDECSTAPQFSRLAEEKGLFFDIGRSGVLDTYIKSLQQAEEEDHPVMVKRHSEIISIIKDAETDVEMETGINGVIYETEREQSRYMYRVMRLMELIDAILEYYTFGEEPYRIKAENVYHQNIEYFNCDWDCTVNDPDFRREFFRGMLLQKSREEIEEDLKFYGDFLHKEILKEEE